MSEVHNCHNCHEVTDVYVCILRMNRCASRELMAKLPKFMSEKSTSAGRIAISHS